jgi:release factor glutamine methyltransferase
MKLNAAIEKTAERLPEELYPHPMQTIRHLVQHRLGINQMEIFLRPDQRLSGDQISELWKSVTRLVNGEPLAYVLGETSFLEWDFFCDARAFIPRPETEDLTAKTREKVKLIRTPDHILDMCCGSGVMGLSLALSFPDSQLLLADYSPEALEVSLKNTEKHQLGGRTRLIQSDLWENIPSDAAFDLMVCNPPYVAGDEYVDTLVLENEPHLALFSRDDGLFHVKKVLSRLDQHLKPHGLAAFELGHTHADRLTPWLNANSFQGRFYWEADPFGVRRFLFYQKERL